MSISASDIIAQAQRDLMDAGAVRASAADYTQWVADAVNEIFVDRPDLRLQADQTLVTISTTTIPLGAEWFAPITAYVRHRFRSGVDPDRASLAAAQQDYEYYRSRIGL